MIFSENRDPVFGTMLVALGNDRAFPADQLRLICADCALVRPHPVDEGGTLGRRFAVDYAPGRHILSNCPGADCGEGAESN
jgi:hypothetical protein